MRSERPCHLLGTHVASTSCASRDIGARLEEERATGTQNASDTGPAPEPDCGSPLHDMVLEGDRASGRVGCLPRSDVRRAARRGSHSAAWRVARPDATKRPKIPDAQGLFIACYAKQGGAVRLVPKRRCKQTERRATWFQKGRLGPRGAAGVAGATGAAGLHRFDRSGWRNGRGRAYRRRRSRRRAGRGWPPGPAGRRRAARPAGAPRPGRPRQAALRAPRSSPARVPRPASTAPAPRRPRARAAWTRFRSTTVRDRARDARRVRPLVSSYPSSTTVWTAIGVVGTARSGRGTR